MNFKKTSDPVVHASAGTRRAFLASAALAGIAAGTVSQRTASAGETLLRANRDHDLFRVRMEIDVKGNVNLAKDPMVPESPKQVLPVVGEMKLDYEERYLRPSGAAKASEIIAAERYFFEASGESKLNRSATNTELRTSLTSVIARRDELPETIYSNDDYLTHEEVDLLRTPLASTAIDQLIPTQSMREGETVEISRQTLASVLNLSAVAGSDVQMELISADSKQAKLQMRGKLDGSVAGVPTEIRILGKLTVDRSSNCVTWAAIAMHETRQIGKAVPGFDVTATIRMIRKPLSRPQGLTQVSPRIDFDGKPPQERLLMSIKSDAVGASALMDRRWRVMKDAPGEAILRMIDNDRSIAQLNLRPMPRLGEGEQWTLAAFERDVRRTLGDRFNELLQSEEKLSESGLRTLRVVASGQVQGVPIQWIMIHFSDDERHRVVATFTMDGQSVPQLDGSDVQLAASMRLIDPKSGGPKSGVAENARDSGEKLGSTESTRLESNASLSGPEVKSPSDAPISR